MIGEILFVTIQVMTILILIRALLSWVPSLIDPRGLIAEFLYTTTEPILGPIRSLMPRMMLDLSPLIAILLLQFVGGAIARSLS
ncbi:MAG TPA: YggT family protein [Dehalococcoidia bacterium]|nr:YggT family protein [Dehalococcoidia bacterium]